MFWMFWEHVGKLSRKRKFVFTKTFILLMEPWHVARRKHDVILHVIRIIRTFEHKPYQICFWSNIPGIRDCVHMNFCPLMVFSISHWRSKPSQSRYLCVNSEKSGFASCSSYCQGCSENCKVVLMIEDIVPKKVKVKT